MFLQSPVKNHALFEGERENSLQKWEQKVRLPDGIFGGDQTQKHEQLLKMKTDNFNDNLKMASSQGQLKLINQQTEIENDIIHNTSQERLHKQDLQSKLRIKKQKQSSMASILKKQHDMKTIKEIQELKMLGPGEYAMNRDLLKKTFD